METATHLSQRKWEMKNYMKNKVWRKRERRRQRRAGGGRKKGGDCKSGEYFEKKSYVTLGTASLKVISFGIDYN